LCAARPDFRPARPAAHGIVFVADGDEAAVVAGLDVTARPLALLDNRVDRGQRRGEIGHGNETRKRDELRADLGSGIADEETCLAKAVGESAKAAGDGAIEVADRLIVLRARHDDAIGTQPAVIGDGGLEAGALDLRRVVRPFQIDEVLQRFRAERRQLHVDARRVVAGGNGKVRPAEMRRAADRGHQVGDEREMAHLLDGDTDDGAPPAGDHRVVLGTKPVGRCVLQAEGGIKVAAHQVVLDLRRLGQRIEELLARANFDVTWIGLGHGRCSRISVLRLLIVRPSAICDSGARAAFRGSSALIVKLAIVAAVDTVHLAVWSGDPSGVGVDRHSTTASAQQYSGRS